VREERGKNSFVFFYLKREREKNIHSSGLNRHLIINEVILALFHSSILLSTNGKLLYSYYNKRKQKKSFYIIFCV